MINIAKDLISKNKKSNNIEVNILIDILLNNNINDYINKSSKKFSSDRSYIELVNDYIDTPYLFVFVPKNSYIANLLYKKSHQFHEIDLEYEDIFMNKIFPDQINFKLSVEKKDSLINFFTNIDEKISNIEVEIENICSQKMKDFNLIDYIEVNHLLYKEMIEKMKELESTSREFKDLISDIELNNLEEIIIKLIPHTSHLSGSYLFKEYYIKGNVSDSFLDYSESYFKQLSQEYYQKSKDNKRKYLKSIYTLGKISLSIAYPPALLASRGEDLKSLSDFVDLLKDSKESISDHINIECFDVKEFYIEFRNSDYSTVKEYFIHKFKKAIEFAFKDLVKMNINLPFSFYENLYKEFQSKNLLSVLEELDENRIKEYNEKEDKDLYLMEYIYDEDISKISNFY